MSVREVRAVGLDAQGMATSLLQRARLSDPLAGIWEAADVQWWWRTPRASDEVEKLFWVDEDGPVAGVLLTAESDGTWQCDPVIVPHASAVDPEVVWARALESAAAQAPNEFAVPVSDGDEVLRAIAGRSGLEVGYHDSTAWMEAAGRPALLAPPEGFVLADRMQRADTPHHMIPRNTDEVGRRLAEGSLYDPALDLVVETTDGEVAGYALFWFDPMTGVGLVEPVRTVDEFQRRGIARSVLTAGVDHLVARGAQRIKISYGSEAAGALYEGVGFQPTSTTTWYVVPA